MPLHETSDVQDAPNEAATVAGSGSNRSGSMRRSARQRVGSEPIVGVEAMMDGRQRRDDAPERWRRPSKDGGPSAIGHQGPVEGAILRGDRATATFEDICNRAIPALFYVGWYTKAVRDVVQCNY
jgi:hypothetical protein